MAVGTNVLLLFSCPPLISITSDFPVGQLFAAVGLKAHKDKDGLVYLPLIYPESAMLGIMAGVYVYVPESVCERYFARQLLQNYFLKTLWLIGWCAKQGKHDKGRAVLARLNGDAEGYDVDFYYGLLHHTVEIEMKRDEDEIRNKQTTFWQSVKETKEIFVGSNGLRTLIAFFPAAIQQLSGLAGVRALPKDVGIGDIT